MTGADFQLKLDAIVTDLQTVGKGQTVQVLARGSDNQSVIFPLSSSVTGVINAAQFNSLTAFVGGLKPIADFYESRRLPVVEATEAFNLRRATHQMAIDAASAARVALNTELMADSDYQSLSAALEAARTDPPYVQAVSDYRDGNVSENYAELSSAKGKYVTAPTT